jgi:hypothetical protein
MASLKNESTRNSKEQAPALAYINVGKKMASDKPDGGEYMLSPFFGIAVTADAQKSRLSKQERSLYAAVLAKVEEIKAAGGEGKAHSINLDIEIFVPSEEPAEVDTGDFKL